MKIKLINGKYTDVPFNEEIQKHFEDPHNYTDAILNQFEDSIYKEYLSETDNVILDIGANIGLFALHVFPYAKKLICVEPTPEHMRKQKFILNGLGITHIEAALSDRKGEETFFWCGINTTMNSLQPRGDRSFQVQSVTLADIVTEEIDFCKIDIEGSEWKAITEETLKPVAGKIKKIFIELHPPNGESQEHFKKIFEKFYKVEKVIHDTLFCYDRA